MLTRLMGSDAEVEYSEDLLDLIRRMEVAFPAPEWAVLFNDSDEEDEPDEIVVCRRYAGVLMPVAYADIDEIAEMEAGSTDWIAGLAGDLSRTQVEIDAEIAAAEEAGD